MARDKVEEAEWKYVDVNEHWQQMKNMVDTAQDICGMSKGPCRYKETWWCNEEVAEAHTHNCFTADWILSRITGVSQYQKGKTKLYFTEASDSERQWHQLAHMQICTSSQADNYASTLPLNFLQVGCLPFLPPIQQRQSTEGSRLLKL